MSVLRALVLLEAARDIQAPFVLVPVFAAGFSMLLHVLFDRIAVVADHLHDFVYERLAGVAVSFDDAMTVTASSLFGRELGLGQVVSMLLLVLPHLIPVLGTKLLVLASDVFSLAITPVTPVVE
jgi:hypothetical protein